MAGLRSGPPNEAHTQKVLSVIDTNAAFLQAPGVGDQISSAIDRVLQGFAEVNRKVWLGSKFIDSSVSPICYERRLREGNSELKRLALEKPTFRPIIPEAKPTLQDETGAVLVDFSKQKEDTGAPYESFHQALRALTPPIQAVRGSDTYPSRWKNINAPVREALLVFPWDLDDFPESPPQKRDGQSFVSVSAEEQAFTKEDIMMIFTALPATPAALQSFLEGSPVDKGEERGYQRTLGAFKEAAKQHGVQLIFVNTAVAHGGGHDEMAGIASTDSLELALHEAGIGILPLQALAFGGDSIPAFATLPALLGQPVKPVSESPVCAGFFGEIPIQLSHQRPEGSPKNPPALAVFGSSTTVALLRPSDEKWYRAPRKDLDRQEQYTLRSEGGGQAAAYFADILCKLNNQHSVLFLTVQDEAFSFNAVLEPCSPSCALLTLRRDAILASTQLQLSLLAESAWKPESCQLVDQIAADIRRAYVALKAQLAAQQKVAAPPCTELVGALKEASQEREVEYKEELPWIQKLPAARPLLPSHEWGEGDTKYWQSGGGKKRPGRRRSKEGKEGAEKSQRKRPREGAEAGEKLERRKKRREGKLMKAEGAEKGEEAKRPQEEEADSGRREGPQRSENKSASAGQKADGAVPRSFKSRIGGRHVAALLGQKAGGGNAAPSQVPKAPPSGLPAGPPARQPVSGAKPPADIRKRHAHPASGRGNMSPAQKVSLLRQPGSGAKPLADVSRHEQMRRGPPASGKGNQSPAEEDPEAVKKALKEQAREFAKGGTGGSAADFAKQVVRQAGFVIDRRGEGGAGRPSQKERPSELGEGGQGNGPQTLVLYDPLGNGGALKAEGVQTETLGQELKKMFLLPPKRLREKYMRCRLPAEGNDGTNEDGLSVADKIREHTLQIFLRLAILSADTPSRRVLADPDPETAGAKVQRSMVADITKLLKNIGPNLRREGQAGSPEQDFLDREIKPRYGSKLPDVLNHVYLDNELAAPFPERLYPSAGRKREGGVKRFRKRKLKRPALVPLEDDVNTLLSREREDRRARTNGESMFEPTDPKRMITQQLTLPKPPLGKDKLRQASQKLQTMFGTERSGFRSAPSGFRSDPCGSPPDASSDLTGWLRERRAGAVARLSAGGVRNRGPGAPQAGAPPGGGALALLGPAEAAASDVSNGLRQGSADVSGEAPRADHAPAAVREFQVAVGANQKKDAPRVMQIGGVSIAPDAPAVGKRDGRSQRMYSELKRLRPKDPEEALDRGMTSLAPGQLFTLTVVERPSLGGEEGESEYEIEATPWKDADVDEEKGSEWGSEEKPGGITGLNLESALLRAVEGESPEQTTGVERESGQGALYTDDGAEDSGAPAEGEQEPLPIATSLVEAPVAGDISGGTEREAASEAGAHAGDEHLGLSGPPGAVKEEENSPPEREAAGDPPPAEASPERTPEKRSPPFGGPSQDSENIAGNPPPEETTPPSKSGSAEGSLKKRKRKKGSGVGVRTRRSTPGGGSRLRSGTKLREPDQTWFKARKTPPKGARAPESGGTGASGRKRKRTSGTEPPEGGASEKTRTLETGGKGASDRKRKRTSATEPPEGGARASDESEKGASDRTRNRTSGMEPPGGGEHAPDESEKGASARTRNRTSGMEPLGGGARAPDDSEKGASDRTRNRTSGKELPEGGASEETKGGSVGVRSTPKKGASGESTSGDVGTKSVLEDKASEKESPIVGASRKQPPGEKGSGSKLTRRLGRKKEPLDVAEKSPVACLPNRPSAPAEASPSSVQGGSSAPPAEATPPPQSDTPLAQKDPPDASPLRRYSDEKAKRARAKAGCGGAVGETRGDAAKGAGEGPPRRVTRQSPMTSASVPDTVEKRAGGRERSRTSENGPPEAVPFRTMEGASVGEVPGAKPVPEKAGFRKGTPGEQGAGKLARGREASKKQRPGSRNGNGSSKKEPATERRGAGKSSSAKGENSPEPNVFAASPALRPGNQSPGSLDSPLNRESKSPPSSVKRATLPSASPSTGAPVSRGTRAGGEGKKAAKTSAEKETRAEGEAEKVAGRETAVGNAEEPAASPVGRETRAGRKVQAVAATTAREETRAEGEEEGAADKPGEIYSGAGGKADEPVVTPGGRQTGAIEKAEEPVATPGGRETRAGRKVQEGAATPGGGETRAGRKAEQAPVGEDTEARGEVQKADATQKTRAGRKAGAAQTSEETRAAGKAGGVTATPTSKDPELEGRLQEAAATPAGRETRAGGKAEKAGASTGLVTPGKAPGLRSETEARELSGSSLWSGKKLPLTSAFVPDSEENQSSERKRKRTSEVGTAASERSERGSPRAAAANGTASKKVVFEKEAAKGAERAPRVKASETERTVAGASEKGPAEAGAVGKTRLAKVMQTARTRDEPALEEGSAAADRSTRANSSGKEAKKRESSGKGKAKAASPIAAGPEPGTETPVTRLSGKASPANEAPKIVTPATVGPRKESPMSGASREKASGKGGERTVRGTPGTRASNRGKSGKRRSERMLLTGEAGETIERAKRRKEAAFEAWEGH